jgi:hypothetical protein
MNKCIERIFNALTGYAMMEANGLGYTYNRFQPEARELALAQAQRRIYLGTAGFLMSFIGTQFITADAPLTAAFGGVAGMSLMLWADAGMRVVTNRPRREL